MDHSRPQELSKDVNSDNESSTFSDSLDGPVNSGNDNGSDISFERESDKMSDIRLSESDTASTHSDHAFSEMSDSDRGPSDMSEVSYRAEMTEDGLSDDLGTDGSVSSDFSDSSSEAVPRISVAGCDSCGKSVCENLPYRLGPGYPWLTTGSMSYYHCQICITPLGPDRGTFDLCEKCFANDKWCGSKNHLLSRRSTSKGYHEQKDNYVVKYNPFKARQDLVIFDNSTETLKPIFHLYSNMRVLIDHIHAGDLFQFIFQRVLDDAKRIYPQIAQAKFASHFDGVAHCSREIETWYMPDIFPHSLQGSSVRLRSTPAIAQRCISGTTARDEKFDVVGISNIEDSGR